MPTLALSLSFSGFGWLWPLVTSMAVAAVFVCWSYARSNGPAGVRAASATFKLLGIAALALCLLEPLWNRSRARPGANYFVILADNSEGMQMKDRGAATSRGEQIKTVLTATRATWQETLGDSFQLRRYYFDARLQPTEQFADLDFSGSASAMAAALRRLRERYNGQPLAGILLLTDGNATDVAEAIDASGLPPIYPVVIGRDDVPRDVSLRKVTVTQTSFEDSPVSVQADVAADGYAGEELVAELLDSNGRSVSRQTQRVARNDQAVAFRFRLKPDRSGLAFYQVRAAAKAELAQFSDAAALKEPTLANNQRALVVDRGRGPYRILYVSGRPNWEFKFLNRALMEDDQLQLVGLIRIAKREPKFEFLGRRGESGNPLFRGFDRKDEDAERYDQPVLVRLNTRDEFELKGGFPKTPEELFAYDAVVVDDIESEFFTRDQMLLMQRFVSERGGGFLMLGGAESFREGNFGKTPVGDMLPVYLDRAGTAAPPDARKLALTPEGMLQPWMRLRDNETDERARISGMPPFQVLNDTEHVKPGAHVLATVVDSQSRRAPALVFQRFGHGRTAALLVGDLWRWGLRDEAMHRDMDKAWRQLVRWLVTDVPNRVTLLVTAQPAEESVALEVRVREKNFQPMENATVQLTVSPVQASAGPPTNRVRLAAQPAANESGTYRATYLPRHTGGYRAEAVVLDANGVEVGRAEAGWTSDPAAEEFRSLKPNRALLEQLARQTGGSIVPIDQLEKFAADLPNRKAPITEITATPLWHTPAMFLFALACFVAEWGLRRWKGLP